MPLCHCGPDSGRADADVAPLRGFGPPALDLVERMPYPRINTLLDEGFPKGALSYWKSAFLRELSDDVIGVMVDRFAACPSPDDRDGPQPLPRRRQPGARRRDGHAPPPARLQPRHPWPMGRPGRERRQHHLDSADVRSAPPPHGRTVLRERPLRRRRQPDPLGVRAQLEPPRRHQTPLRPRQHLPPQPEHQPRLQPQSRCRCRQPPGARRADSFFEPPFAGAQTPRCTQLRLGSPPSAPAERSCAMPSRRRSRAGPAGPARCAGPWPGTWLGSGGVRVSSMRVRSTTRSGWPSWGTVTTVVGGARAGGPPRRRSGPPRGRARRRPGAPPRPRRGAGRGPRRDGGVDLLAPGPGGPRRRPGPGRRPVGAADRGGQRPPVGVVAHGDRHPLVRRRPSGRWRGGTGRVVVAEAVPGACR